MKEELEGGEVQNPDSNPKETAAIQAAMAAVEKKFDEEGAAKEKIGRLRAELLDMVSEKLRYFNESENGLPGNEIEGFGNGIAEMLKKMSFTKATMNGSKQK